jgi:hypothetical protein
MGNSRSNAAERYIIQLKSPEKLVYTANNVLVCRAAKHINFPRFEFTGLSTEKQLLLPPLSEPDISILVTKAENPLLSLGEIAKQLNTNKMKVKRVLEKYGYKTVI